jgi:hypothetical protein
VWFIANNQFLQPQVPPCGLPARLRGALDPKCRVLVGHYVVFVFGIRRLEMRWDENGLRWGERGAGEILRLFRIGRRRDKGLKEGEGMASRRPALLYLK